MADAAAGSLTSPVLCTQRKVGLITLRGYLSVAFVLVIVKVIQSTTG